MNILAIDPGQTTGVCLIRTEPTDKGFSVIAASEIVWNMRFAHLHALINGAGISGIYPETEPPGFVVMEKFRLRQGRAYEQSGSDFPSSQVCGIVEAFLWERAPLETTLYYQEPLAMTRVLILTEDRELVEGSEHMKDAYRHARYFCVTHVLNGSQL